MNEWWINVLVDKGMDVHLYEYVCGLMYNVFGWMYGAPSTFFYNTVYISNPF